MSDYESRVFQERMVTEAFRQDAAKAQMRPSTLYKPRLSIDGNMWSALYGDDLQSGVAGFGKSPAEAYDDFDRAWRKELP